MPFVPGQPAAPLPDVVLLKNVAGIQTSAAFSWPGGPGEMRVTGTISTDTVTLQELGVDGVTWQPVGAATTITTTNLAAGGSYPFNVGQAQLRVAITGGASTGMYVALTRIQARTRR